MKKMCRILAASVLGVFLLAGPAMADTLPNSLTSGYSWINAPFWTNTDLTTGLDGDSQFQLQFEGFTSIGADADFGLFYVNDISAPSSPTLFKVFDKTIEPSYGTKTVSFKNVGDIISITLGSPDGSPVWTPFSSVFGFYFDFTYPPNTNLNATYFSAPVLDVNSSTDPNVFTAANGTNEVNIYLDRFPDTNNLVQMTVNGNDLRPVPEPGTLLLLGSGLLGLVFYGRKRMKA